MKISGIAGIAVSTMLAGSLLAHTGATGVMKERMDAMGLMGFYVKDITPMMRGKEDYDPARVTYFGELLIKHSGEAMTRLFEEGTNGHPSEAKDEIWTNWEEFETLAARLGTLGEGMVLASKNGVKGGGPDAMMDGDTMMGADAGGDTMMGADAGGASMMGGGAMMGAGSMMDDLKPADMAEMPVDAVFQMVSQNCSACHTKFRAEN